MPDYTTDYSATFGPLTIYCEIGYSVEPDEARDGLLVDSVKVIYLCLHGGGSSILCRLPCPSLEPIAEALADKIEAIRKEETWQRCVADYQTQHNQKGRT